MPGLPMPRRPVSVLLVLLLVSLAGCRGRSAGAGSALTVSVPYEVDRLDPHARNVAGPFAVLSHFYEPLVATDAHLALKPALAVRWDNPDPTTWVFHLRPGVTFASGRALTAADVVFSIERLKGSGTLEMSSYVGNVAKVVARDPRTVEIRTERPSTVLLSELRFVPIVPAGSTQASLEAAVDGTGPYRLQEFRKGVLLRMERREGYWGPPAPLSPVTFLLARFTEQALADLASGSARLVQCNSKRLEQAVAERPEFRMARQSSLFVKYLSLRFDAAPFQDPRVRKALHLAIDRTRLVSRLSTYAVPASQPVPPFVFGFNPAITLPPYDPVKARALLREAGVREGLEVTLRTRKLFEETARLLAESLFEVGLTVNVVVLPEQEFYPLVLSGKVPALVSRMGCPTGDAGILLDQAVHTRDDVRHLGLGNDSGYSRPEMDALIEASAGQQDPEERRQTLQQIVSRMMEDLPWLPLYVDDDVYAVHQDLAWQPRYDGYVQAQEIQQARR